MSVYKRFNGKKVVKGDKNYGRGTWYYRFTVRGKTYHQAVPEAGTIDKAKKAETAARNAVFNNRYGKMIDETTFTDFVDEVYIEYVRQHNVNIYSKQVYINVLNDFFGKMLLKEITPQDCRNFIAKRKRTKTIHGKQRAFASINKELTTLSKIFNLAIEENKLDSNPMRFVKKLKGADPRSRILSDDERVRFFEHLENDKLLYNLSMIAMHTGLRRGQILAIEVEDIDLEKRVLQAIASKGRGRRPIALNRTMVNLLSELVSKKKTGKLFTIANFRKRWYDLMSKEKANIKDFRFHDLKHQFSTDLVKAGVPPSMVQLLFAHSDMRITETYINDELNMMRSALENLDVQTIEKMQ